jgi:prepilin-type processing-associated H-X9-DG protein
MERAAKNFSRQREAFTLPDLLAVVAVLTALAALALPALAGAKGQTRIAHCEANLRQLAVVMQIYGNENNNRLPGATSGTGSWAWDFSLPVVDSLLNSGAKRVQMYDPGFPEQNDDSLWNLGPYRVLGYALAINGALIDTTNINASLFPAFQQAGILRIPAPASSARVLTACATLNVAVQNPNVLAAAQYNWTHVLGLSSFNGGSGHRAAHMAGQIPAGGNVGMLDGHVEWRPFANMQSRVSNGTPNFWW